MKISKENCIEVILERFPAFQTTWDKFLKEWEGEEYMKITVFHELADYLIERIQQGTIKEPELATYFNFIEFALINGDEDAKAGASTFFLEAMLHATPGKVSALTFVHLLGERSRDFCKAWDEFTGVKTEGLWK